MNDTMALRGAVAGLLSFAMAEEQALLAAGAGRTRAARTGGPPSPGGAQ